MLKDSKMETMLKKKEERIGDVRIEYISEQCWPHCVVLVQ